VRRRPDFAGKGRGSGPCSPRVPFRGLDGLEERPAVEFGGAMDLRPPRLLFRRDGQLCWGPWSRGRCMGSLRWWKMPQATAESTERGTSAVAAAMAMAEWTERAVPALLACFND
jgi:hypothetical protein